LVFSLRSWEHSHFSRFLVNEISVLYRFYCSFQVILLEEAWAELFLLNAVQWCMPLESSPLFSVSEHAAGVPNGKDSQVAADVRTLNDTLLRFKAVGVDPAEFACLKAIVLFRSG
jgi:nuclear receptor subfamily 2 group E protein 3